MANWFKGIAFMALIAAIVMSYGRKSIAGSLGPLRTEIHTVILHTISGPSCLGGRVVYPGAPGDAVRWKNFFDRHPFLGIHYVIDPEGRVAASTPENRTANHALGNNEGTIGIELVHKGDGIAPFSDPLLESLINLIKDIQRRHKIPAENIKSHAEVDTRTFLCGGQMVRSRMDPGANFPWSRLRSALAISPSEELSQPPN